MKFGAFSLVVLLLVLVACSNQLMAEPGDVKISEPADNSTEDTTITETESDPCQDVQCKENENCVDGSCVCKKECEGICIAENACCTDDECQGKCIDNECREARCEYGEILEDGECVCREDYKYCKEQGKCISRDSCCTFVNCGSFQDCVSTSLAVDFCVEKEPKKICKLLSKEGRRELFKINGKEFFVEALNFYEGEIEFQLGNETIMLKTNQTIERDGITMWQDNFKVTGGFCREDYDD